MSVDSILFPEVPIALRLSGHLLLGVVRIYSRKVNYLFHDCSEALVKIKQAFHSGLVDLPPEAATAPFHSITLPETFDLDEFELNPERESSFRANSSVDHHVISREQITLQDPLDDRVYLDSQFGLDERFADSDALRMGLDFDEDLLFERPGKREPSPAPTTLIEDVIPATPADDPLDLMMPATPEDDPLDLQTMPATPTDDSLDLQMMPATPADDALDFQPMDNDDQHEPSTPALASDMMDLDEHHQPSASVLGVDQMELEDRIEPSTTVQTLDHLGANQPESVQPASKNPELVERILSPIELREENLDNLTTVELPNREVLINENVLAESSEAKKVNIDMEQLPSEKIQLCEYNLQTEKARSVVEVKEQELDAFVGAKDCVFEEHYIQDKAAEDNSKIAEDRGEEAILKVTIQGVEKVKVLEETPMRDYSSSFPPRPMPYYSAPTPSTIKFSGDNDVLATILGRSTPAIRVAPTPSETPALKRRKPGPKPSVRKRKPIFDVSMVLHGEVMRQQEANTKDIRRSRKKAPCTLHEIWVVQKEALGQQAFYEPSFPGQSEKIQELYNRLFGVSGAKLSPASCDANLPHSEIVLEISVDKIEPARKFNNNGNSQPERNAEASVDITVTALPNLVESEPLECSFRRKGK
ncbi:hypothetical protein O6H91_01G147900 [Diphasiastrum complanatum]|nr:hypothetical protein O6H91_01G147900 [Diphasiastrum complanatum]